MGLHDSPAQSQRLEDTGRHSKVFGQSGSARSRIFQSELEYGASKAEFSNALVAR